MMKIHAQTDLKDLRRTYGGIFVTAVIKFKRAYSPPREGINVLDESEIKPGRNFKIGEEIPLLAEEGWTRHEENVPLPIWRGRGGQFGEVFRPEPFAKLTTPSASLRWLRDFLLMPQPALLCEEGNDD